MQEPPDFIHAWASENRKPRRKYKRAVYFTPDNELDLALGLADVREIRFSSRIRMTRVVRLDQTQSRLNDAAGK